MTLLQIALLALIQGLTEFLPVSSSAHLLLIPSFLGWQPQGQVMDVAVHVGTLGAIIVYFRQDLGHMIAYMPQFLQGRWQTPVGREMLCLMIGTLPTVAVGLFLSELGLQLFQSLTIIGLSSIVFGTFLYMVDRQAPTTRTIDTLTLKDAGIIGLVQAFALIPGASRSGMCIIGSRALGLKRPDAAKFSFLLSIPVIIAAAVHTGYKASKGGEWILLEQGLWGVGLAFLAGLVAINFMMWWLQRARYTPFALYRIILGIVLLLVGKTL